MWFDKLTTNGHGNPANGPLFPLTLSLSKGVSGQTDSQSYARPKRVVSWHMTTGDFRRKDPP